MYKTISVDEQTYILLDRMSSQMEKPKTQVVRDLIQFYGMQTKDANRSQTNEFHEKMNSIRKKIVLPKGSIVDVMEIEKELYSDFDKETK